ncbi:hypothetical protein K1719_016205 [Acacia pycnantha]|nr:hypothetical protein K1719_016205 [Acacia pycnantha]
MEKVGRRRDKVWERVTLLEGGRRWRCNDCGEEFPGGASRIKAHVNKLKGTGIRPCTGKTNSNNDIEHNLLHSQDLVVDLRLRLKLQIVKLTNRTQIVKLQIQIYVFFHEEAKVGVKTMKTYTNRMKSENVSRAMSVVPKNLTPFAQSCIL